MTDSKGPQEKAFRLDDDLPHVRHRQEEKAA